MLPRIESPVDLRNLDRAELRELAGEIRRVICEQVSHSGGHLAPNLGVVELTIALHTVFDFSRDRLLFDVGHQCYPHKLLTGRRRLFGKLRHGDGLSGFPEPRESNYDLFAVGHAGTSISTAVGMARADALLGRDHRRVVALVGDASIVNGVAVEGLNNAGTLRRQFLVVLNDNGMSIAKPQGALAKAFDRVRGNPGHVGPRRGTSGVLRHSPFDEALEQIYSRGSKALKALVLPGHFFSQMGLVSLGPVDGHDVSRLIDVLAEVKELEHPVLLHCKTVKGKGYDFSTDDPTTFHSPRPFSIVGSRVEMKQGGRSYTVAFGDALADLMQRDERIFAVTAAMPCGTGLARIMRRFPERTLDTGICESHAMGMCAGMAKAGLKPFFAVYSTFAQRALDQVFQEVALQGLPVRVCMDRAGYVGGDGAVHHGFLDVALFRPLPDAVLLAACDEPNLRAALEFQRTCADGPSFLRYPRDRVPVKPLQPNAPPYVLGRANLVRASWRSRPQLAILSYGGLLYEALAALLVLERDGYDLALYDARFAKPVDVALLRRLCAAAVPVLTLEDHALAGGFGSAVLEACDASRLRADLVHRLGMPDRWVRQNTRENQLAEVGLDSSGIERALRATLLRRGVRPSGKMPEAGSFPSPGFRAENV